MKWRKRLLPVAMVFVAAVTVIVFVRTDPLRGSDASIRAWLLTKTPIGMSSEEVREIAREKGWFDPLRQRSDGITSGPYIRGELGGYWTVPVYIHVAVIWAFDPGDRLTEIRIWKTVEGF